VQRLRFAVVHDGKDVGPAAGDRVRPRRVDDRLIGVPHGEGDVPERRRRPPPVVDALDEHVPELVGDRGDIVGIGVRLVDERRERDTLAHRGVVVAGRPYRIEPVRVLVDDGLEALLPPVRDDRVAVLRRIHSDSTNCMVKK